MVDGVRMENLIIKVMKILLKISTPSQTAWALMGLLATGEIGSLEVENGLKYLTNKKI